MKNQIIDIIPQKFRRKGVIVALSLLLRGALNFIGLAMLLPVLALVLNPQSIEGRGLLARIYTATGFGSFHTFAIAVCIAVVIIIVIKCAVNLWLARFERNYIYDLYRTLSRRLYITYHNRGLSFIKSSNSAVLSRNVNVVCLAFATGVLKPIASIAAEAVLLILLFGALLWYAPLAAALSIAVFIPSIWIYYGLVRNRINRYGEQENRAQREKAKIVSETFRGYADIEIGNAFPMMLRSFDNSMEQVIYTRLKETSINMLPQTLTEIGLAIGMALLVALSLGSNQGSIQLMFGIFAVAALRLMPSVRAIMSAWASLKYNRYTIDILRDAESMGDSRLRGNDKEGSGVGDCRLRGNDKEGSGNDTHEILPFEREITVSEVSFRFEDDSRKLFDNLNITIRKGERVGIRGASGAGKTTLFNLLLGLYQPTAGEISIDGVKLTPTNRRAWQNRIGYVSQSLFIADDTFAANVALGVPDEQIDRQRVKQVLEAAQLGELIAGLPNGVDTHVGECGCRLSGGQRQRIGIARALYRRADVLFFDEATSALDSRTEEDINRSIAAWAAQDKGLTIIVIAHRESSLEYCNRIIEL